MTHKHAITHIEIPTTGTKESARFFKEVFDWKTTDYPDMNYVVFEAEGGTGGGFSPVTEENPIGNILLYINTPNLEESLEKIRANGGEVLMESFEIDGVGTMATFRDPSGNLLALLQPLME